MAKTSNKDGLSVESTSSREENETNLLICDALIRHKAIGEDGDDGRAVVARVGGDDGEQGGADEERLHLLLGELGRLTGRVWTTWSAEGMKIAAIYLDKHWSWWTFCRSEIKTFNASLQGSRGTLIFVGMETYTTGWQI